MALYVVEMRSLAFAAQAHFGLSAGNVWNEAQLERLFLDLTRCVTGIYNQPLT